MRRSRIAAARASGLLLVLLLVAPRATGSSVVAQAQASSPLPVASAVPPGADARSVLQTLGLGRTSAAQVEYPVADLFVSSSDVPDPVSCRGAIGVHGRGGQQRPGPRHRRLHGGRAGAGRELRFRVTGLHGARTARIADDCCRVQSGVGVRRCHAAATDHRAAVADGPRAQCRPGRGRWARSSIGQQRVADRRRRSSWRRLPRLRRRSRQP